MVILAIPSITIMMIQMCTFPPQRGKSSNCNDVRYGCLDGLRGDYHHSDHSHALYIYRKNVSPQLPQTP
ncbi:hypothetical protein BER09_05890 [Escherichia coli]|nr:hypothetical protein BER09_05890 [Escherichia coli]